MSKSSPPEVHSAEFIAVLLFPTPKYPPLRDTLPVVAVAEDSTNFPPFIVISLREPPVIDIVCLPVAEASITIFNFLAFAAPLSASVIKPFHE